MKIRFTRWCQVETAVDTKPNGEPIFETDEYDAGEEIEVEVINFGMTADPMPGGNGFMPNKNWPQFQFADGSVTTGIHLDDIRILEGQDEFDEAWAGAVSADAVDDAVVEAQKEEEQGTLQNLDR